MQNQPLSVRFNRALQLEKKGDHEKALHEYRAIIAADPKFRDAYINLGSLYSRMDRLAEAMLCFETAITLGGDFVTFFNIGSIYYKMGDYRKALTHLLKSIELNPNFALSKLVAGLCHSRLSRFNEAEKYFLDVLRINPDNRVALTALAILYYNKTKLNLSLQMLNRLLDLDANNIKIRKFKSDILLKIGRYDESSAEIKVIKRKSSRYKYFDEYIKSVPVEILSDKYGTIDEKIKSLNDTVQNTADNLISLSLCHLLKGDTDKAIDYLFQFKKKLN